VQVSQPRDSKVLLALGGETVHSPSDNYKSVLCVKRWIEVRVVSATDKVARTTLKARLPSQTLLSKGTSLIWPTLVSCDVLLS
jgi:hypothetical protein